LVGPSVHPSVGQLTTAEAFYSTSTPRKPLMVFPMICLHMNSEPT